MKSLHGSSVNIFILSLRLLMDQFNQIFLINHSGVVRCMKMGVTGQMDTGLFLDNIHTKTLHAFLLYPLFRHTFLNMCSECEKNVC